MKDEPLARQFNKLKDAFERAQENVETAADRMVSGSKGVADTTVATASEKLGAASETVTRASSSIAGSTLEAARSAPEQLSESVRRIGLVSGRALEATMSLSNSLLAMTPALLASRLSTDLNGLLNDMVEGTATIYDKAMDAEYLTTYIGGGNHRLFDGGHTIWGAIAAGREASPDDNLIQEASGILQGLLRDVTTAKGLPLANWDKGTYDQVSGALEANFHIPKAWFYDLNSYDAAELLGGSIGVVALALHWNRADTESFARLVGSLGVSAAISANPLLLIVTVVALAKAFHRSNQTGEYAEFVDGLLKGGVGAGATLAAVSLVGVAGGPAGAALLAGLATGILVNVATKNVSVVEISQFMAEHVSAAAKEAGDFADRQIEALKEQR